MASFFKLILDTTGPTFSGIFNGGFPTTNEKEPGLRLLVESDPEPLTGFQLKIWGDVDETVDPAIQEKEEDSEWVTYGEAAEKLLNVPLSEGDGFKTIKVKIRDDVWNESATEEFEVELNTAAAIITITAGPTPGKISKVTGKRVSTFTFKSSEDLVSWETWVVPNGGSLHEEGTKLEDSGPSENLDGGELEAEKGQTVKIDGADLDNATPEDGEYIIKVFGQNAAANWSV